MISLLTYIYNQLKLVHSNVYFEQAPENATFPYIVFKLPNSTENEAREDFILEVDIWDNNSDTTTLETLTNNIDTQLNRTHHTETNVVCSIYRINRLMIPDPDPNIRRRQLRYQVQTYFR